MHDHERPGAPRTYPAPSQRNAIWALLLTIFGPICCFIPVVVGAVMAFKVINRSDDEGVNHGRELATGALGVAAFHLGSGILALWFVFGTDIDGWSAGEYAAEPQNADPDIVAITDLHVRDCFDDPSMRGDRGPLRKAACGDPHDAEILRFVHLTQDEFPSRSEIDAAAKDCADAFTDYVGTPPARSEFALTYYYPTKAAWLDSDARAVTCVVWDPDGKLDTAVWDSGR